MITKPVARLKKLKLTKLLTVADRIDAVEDGDGREWSIVWLGLNDNYLAEYLEDNFGGIELTLKSALENDDFQSPITESEQFTIKANDEVMCYEDGSLGLLNYPELSWYFYTYKFLPIG